MSRLNFQIEATAAGSRARAARFKTLHNEVETPIFMPVGTQATVRAQTWETIRELNPPILLANTYHLLLRPGIEVFQKLKGIHGLTGWRRSFLTDSGGFQIFSLPHARKMTEEGASFKSWIDGKAIHLSPEKSIEMQKVIGSDIMMVLDQCIPSTSAKDESRAAMELTHRWAARSLEARGDSPQAMFGIVQGACHPELRRESAQVLREMPFDGLAIGGLAVGETKAEREDMTALVTDELPTELPRYLMGVGTPIDLLEAVHRGVDMFDCVMPTAWAQQGVVFTSRGKRDLRRGIYRFVEGSLDPLCECGTCKEFSLAYLHHLVKAKEVLGWQLLGRHNLHFYLNLMQKIRSAIMAGTFLTFYERERGRLALIDEEFPSNPPKRKANTVLGVHA